MLLIQRGDYPTAPYVLLRLPHVYPAVKCMTAIVRFSIETKQSRSLFPKLVMLYNQ